jgi:hypothetical protein
MYLTFARPILRYRLAKLEERFSNLRTLINSADAEAAELKNLLIQYSTDAEMNHLSARLDSFVSLHDHRLMECIAERQTKYEWLEDDAAMIKLFESVDGKSIPME